MIIQFKEVCSSLVCNYFQKLKDNSITKEECQKAIVLIKSLAIKNIELSNTLNDKVKLANRNLRKYNSRQEDIEFSITTTLNKVLEKLKTERLVYGAYIKIFMSRWQHLGATIDELLNLCNIDKSYIDKNKINLNKDYGDDTFFSIIFIYYLDYKDNSDFIVLTENAPLTSVIKDYSLFAFLHNDNQASKKIIKEYFKDLVFYTKINIDGKDYLISSDGLDIIPLK